MATKNVKLRVSQTGAEQAAQGMGKLDTSIKSVTSAALKYAGAYFGARGILDAAKSSLSAFGAQELAEKKLATALGKTSQALLNQASALQKVSIFGDEVIIGQQSFLAALGFSEGKIKEIIPVALDLASATGITLESAVRNISKTYGGLTGELGELVPQLKDLTVEQLKNGDALQMLSSLFTGQAAAAADTYTGAMQQMENAVGDFSEIIGSALAPHIGIIAKKITELANGIIGGLTTYNDWKTEVSNVAKGFFGLTQEIDNTSDAMQAQAVLQGNLKLITALQERRNELVAMQEEYSKTAGIASYLLGVDKLAEGSAKQAITFIDEKIKGLQETVTWQRAQIKAEEDKIKAETAATETSRILNEGQRIFGQLLLNDTPIIGQYTNSIFNLDGTIRKMADETFPKLAVEMTTSLEQFMGWGIGTENAINASMSAFNGLSGAVTSFFAAKKAQEMADLRSSKKYIAADAEQRASMEEMLSQEQGKRAQKLYRLEQASSLASIAMNTARAYVSVLPNFILANIIAGMGAVQAGIVAATPPPAYATGGIVPGSSYSGDRVQANVNSGEMILNEQQQKKLFEVANGRGGGGITINVNGNLVASDDEADRFAELIVKRSQLGFNRVAVQ